MPPSQAKPTGNKPNLLGASLSRSNTLAGSLFSTKANNEAKVLPLDRILPDPKQPRKHFDADKLAELAEDIKQHGVLQPPIVRPLPVTAEAEPFYQLVVGERRWRAAQLAGLSEIPVIIRAYTEEEVGAISLVENLQREDLSVEDEARYFQRLTEEFQLSTRQIGALISKGHLYVYRRLKLLERPDLLAQVMAGTLNLNTAVDLIRDKGDENSTEASVVLVDEAEAELRPKSDRTQELTGEFKRIYQFTSYLRQAVPTFEVRDEVQKEGLKQAIEEIEAQLAALKERVFSSLDTSE